MFNFKEMCRMMLVFFFIQNAISYFMGGKATHEPTDL